jgi:soluble lytic murein transglycosylase-like protein
MAKTKKDPGILESLGKHIKNEGQLLKGAASGVLTSILGTKFGTQDWSPPKNESEYLKYKTAIESASKKHNIPENLLTRLLYQESKFDPDVISGKKKSRAGAIGIAQFMPDTAASVSEVGNVDPYDPVSSIYGAAHYLDNLYKEFGNWRDAVAAYNFGRGNVAAGKLPEAPAETQNYYRQILGDSDILYTPPIKGLLNLP